MIFPLNNYKILQILLSFCWQSIVDSFANKWA